MRLVAKTARPSIAAGRVAICAVALLATGCSSRQASYEPPTWSVAGPRQVPDKVAQSDYKAEPGDPIKEAPVEPVRHSQPEVDDPTEPWSRNYGSVRAGAAPVQQQTQPQRISSLAAPVAQ